MDPTWRDGANTWNQSFRDHDASTSSQSQLCGKGPTVTASDLTNLHVRIPSAASQTLRLCNNQILCAECNVRDHLSFFSNSLASSHSDSDGCAAETTAAWHLDAFTNNTCLQFGCLHNRRKKNRRGHERERDHPKPQRRCHTFPFGPGGHTQLGPETFLPPQRIKWESKPPPLSPRRRMKPPPVTLYNGVLVFFMRGANVNRDTLLLLLLHTHTHTHTHAHTHTHKITTRCKVTKTSTLQSP